VVAITDFLDQAINDLEIALAAREHDKLDYSEEKNRSKSVTTFRK
jgi:hypothetical protein